MKPFISIMLVGILVVAVGSSAMGGTMASFFDAEVSTENHMQSGTRMIAVTGGPIEVDWASPSTSYEHEIAVINVGTLEGEAWLHIMNLKSIEDKPGPGDATAEPELVAEEGGWHGQVELEGLGVDTGDDALGPASLKMANFVDVEIWYDEDNDCTAEKLVASGKLAEVECEWYELGLLPATPQIKIKGGGWGTYFPYIIDTGLLETVLVAGQRFIVGRVTVETDGSNLIVIYDTSAYGWAMAESHLYVGETPPEKAAPGKFPYTSNPDNQPPDDTMYAKEISPYIHKYIIPLDTITVSPGDTVYIAAHASDGDTAWAVGEYRKLLIRLHFPDIDEDDLIDGGIISDPGTGYGYFDENDPDVALKCWDHWPTNAYMGDKCFFDIEFLLAWEGQEPSP